MDDLSLFSRAGLIITRTALRISFVGGGTDFPDFYRRHGGAVLSTAINKYVYVILKKHNEIFDEPIRLNYSETEHARSVDEVKNDIARECLRFLPIELPIFISTIADVPAASGLGSSSAFAVGLLNALHANRGERVSPGQLAEEAAHIEIDCLKRPIGKQDHYSAAFGGINLIRFLSDGNVSVQAQTFGEPGADYLFKHLMLFWTSVVREAHTILSEQQENIQRRQDELQSLRDRACQLSRMLTQKVDPQSMGALLDETWQIKRGLASRISSQSIDVYYRKAMQAGAYGGKLCGAGGGGFLLFIVPPEKQNAVRLELKGLYELPIAHEPRGARVLMPLID